MHIGSLRFLMSTSPSKSLGIMYPHSFVPSFGLFIRQRPAKLIFRKLVFYLFISEVTNKVINIFLLLVLIYVILFLQNGSILMKALAVSIFSVRILYDIYQIIKIKKPKAD